MLRIAAIDNLSARAYRLRHTLPWGVATFLSPTRVHTATLFGSCDASLLPTSSLEELGELVEPVGQYGIACTGAVGSVILQTRRPIETLVRGGLRIAVTDQSVTSRRLLVRLCRLSFGQSPVLVGLEEESYARLLIGDDAYLAQYSSSHGWMNYDMCAWWYEVTGLPFVFARWVVRRDLSVLAKERIVEWLEACALEAEGSGGRDRMYGMGPDLFAGSWEANDYYGNLRNRLTESDLEAVEYFRRLGESPQCHHIVA